MSKLELHVENVQGDTIPNLARFAHYIGVVAQINGSLIESVTINGGKYQGPEVTSADGRHLYLGAAALPPMLSVKPAAIAAWCGAALHGFAHSRYSPRTDEPLRATLAKRKMHRTWNMIEDARIERLLLRDFPGWQPHLLGACNHILLTPKPGKPKPDLASVFPLIVGRTYLPVALRQESYDAFAAENSEYIADAVHDLVFQYLMVVDPGSEDHDLTVDIVSRLHSLLGDYGSDCGSHEVEQWDDTDREWTDPGDPDEDGDDDDDDGNQVVTDPDDEPDDDGDDGDGESDDDDDDGEGDGEGDPCDDGDESDDGDGDDGDGDGDDGDGDDADGDGDGDGDGDDADADDGESGGNDDEGTDDAGDGNDDESDDDESGHDDDDGHGDAVGGGVSSTSRLADWSTAIDSALAQDGRLADVAEAITSGPMPLIRLRQRDVVLEPVPFEVQQAELDIARELRVLMDGARPGMRRRIDRGRFNVARLVREGGTTRPEEMFDRHDPGALRSTGCAVAVLADVSGSMSEEQLFGAMQSVWAIDRAVQSVRGQFQGYTFGQDSQQLPPSQGDGVWVPVMKDGNTNPVAGLASAQAWLSQQREPNKLCIIATDGAWDGHTTSVNTLLSMVSSGVQVAVFGINTDVSHRFPLEVTTLEVSHANQIGPAIGAMLVNRIRKSVHR